MFIGCAAVAPSRAAQAAAAGTNAGAAVVTLLQLMRRHRIGQYSRKADRA
jgi:hypothetical protein